MLVVSRWHKKKLIGEKVMFFGGYIDLLILVLGFSVGVVLGAAILYWLITLIVYLFTPIEEKRLDLQGEQVLDSLRTWSLRAKQTAILTNRKLYQTGVFRYGKNQRMNIIPLDSIDSVQIATGRNYIWLALSVATMIAVLYGSSNRTAGATTVMLLVAACLFGFFWISGSRQIVVRSITAAIVIDASIMNMSFLSSLSAGGASPMTEERVFSFANRIQDLITKPHGFKPGVVVDSPAPSASAPPAPVPPAPAPVSVATPPSAPVAPASVPPVQSQNISATVKCGRCGALVARNSRFCEKCGQHFGTVNTA